MAAQDVQSWPWTKRLYHCLKLIAHEQAVGSEPEHEEKGWKIVFIIQIAMDYEYLQLSSARLGLSATQGMEGFTEYYNSLIIIGYW